MNPLSITTIGCILLLTNQARSRVVKIALGAENELNGLGEKLSELEETISKLADKDNELEKNQ